MHLYDLVSARSDNAAVVLAPLVAAGMKDQSNKPIRLADPEKERQEFLERLRRPFDYDRIRAAVLKVVAS